MPKKTLRNMDYVMLLIGLIVLVVAGNYLVDSATGIARHFKLPPLIIGLTVVAFGTSAPELFVSLLAGFHGNGSMALGNVVGSNILNVSVICGLTALICPFAVSRQSITTDTLFLLLLTALMGGAGILCGGVPRWVGLLLFALLAAFTVRAIKRSRQELEDGTADPEAEADIPRKSWPLWLCCAILAASIGGLSYGADLMVASAERIAEAWGVPQRVIAVTVVALGTSLPELTASAIGALKGESDLTVGNIVGSNIFNIGCVLGLSSAVNPIAFGAGTGVSALQYGYDVGWMLLFALMLLVGMINVTGNLAKFRQTGRWGSLLSADDGLIGRIWGACALALYAFYVCTVLGVVQLF